MLISVLGKTEVLGNSDHEKVIKKDDFVIDFNTSSSFLLLVELNLVVKSFKIVTLRGYKVFDIVYGYCNINIMDSFPENVFKVTG